MARQRFGAGKRLKCKHFHDLLDSPMPDWVKWFLALLNILE